MAKSFEELDKAIGVYYKSMGRDDYFDGDGNGKFLTYCQHRGFEADDMGHQFESNHSDCSYIEFDDDHFPLNKDQEDEDMRHSLIFEIIKYCYDNNKAPQPSDIQKLDDQVDENHTNNNDNYDDDDEKKLMDQDHLKDKMDYYKMKANKDKLKLWNLTLYTDNADIPGQVNDAINIDKELNFDLRYLFVYLLDKYYSADFISTNDYNLTLYDMEDVYSSVNMFASPPTSVNMFDGHLGSMSASSGNFVSSTASIVNSVGTLVEKDSRDAMKIKQLNLLEAKYKQSERYRQVLDAMDDMYYDPNDNDSMKNRNGKPSSVASPSALSPTYSASPRKDLKKKKELVYQTKLNVDFAKMEEITMYAKKNLNETRDVEKLVLKHGNMIYDCFDAFEDLPGQNSLGDAIKKYDSHLFDLIVKWYCISFGEFGNPNVDSQREELFVFGLLSDSVKCNVEEKTKEVNLSLIVWNTKYLYKSEDRKHLEKRPSLATLLSDIKKTDYYSY